MNFLKKKRKSAFLTAQKLGEKTGINPASILAIEIDREVLGEERARKLSEELDISEDVMTVYRGRLPSYAKEIYQQDPEHLEKVINRTIKKLKAKS